MRKSLRKNIVLILIFSSVFAFGQNSESNSVTKRNTPVENSKANFYEVQKDFNKQWQDKTPMKGEGYKVFKRWENYMTPRVYPSGDISLPSTTYTNYMEWMRQNNTSKSASATSSANWTSLGPVAVPSGYDAGVGRVDFVRFDPTNSNTLYIGSPDGGLWKSTTGGTSWTTNTDFLPILGVADLAIDFNNTQNMYMATGSWEGDKASIGMWKSTDGGNNWVATTGLSWNVSDQRHIRKLIMDPINPMVMLIATDYGIYRTDDGWATSTEVLNDPSYKIDDIKFKPGFSGTVYAIGFDSYWISTNNGASWTKN